MSSKILESILISLLKDEKRLNSEILQLDFIIESTGRANNLSLISSPKIAKSNQAVQIKIPLTLESRISDVLQLAKNIDTPVTCSEIEDKIDKNIKIDSKLKNLKEKYLTSKPKKTQMIKNTDKITNQIKSKLITIKKIVVKEVVPLHKPKNEEKVEIIIDKNELIFEKNCEIIVPESQNKKKLLFLNSLNFANDEFVRNTNFIGKFDHFEVENELIKILDYIFKVQTTPSLETIKGMSFDNISQVIILNQIFVHSKFFEILQYFNNQISLKKNSKNCAQIFENAGTFFDIHLLCVLIYAILKKNHNNNDQNNKKVDFEISNKQLIFDKWKFFLDNSQKISLSRENFQEILTVLRQIHILSTKKNCLFLIN